METSSKFKVGDRVRAKSGHYQGYTAGSRYNLPRTDLTVLKVELGFVVLEVDGQKSPALNPGSFGLVVPQPVRLVTRQVVQNRIVREIQDGGFGRIRVLNLAGVSDRQVGLRFTSSDNAALAALDAEEITAAIETLTTIRDAMVNPNG